MPLSSDAPAERLPAAEAADRLARLRRLWARMFPEVEGLLAFSRANLYYLAGSPAGGALWIPREGDPVLAVRRARRRSRRESPLEKIVHFRSFSELPAVVREAGGAWPEPGGRLGVEMGGLSWALAELFRDRLGAWRFVNMDAALARARALKTPWELAKLREAGRLHDRALGELLPGRIRAGMTERDIAWTLWGIFGELGHTGPLRTQGLGDEIFLGHVSAGDSANWPGHFNGPMGLAGEHAAAPVAGSRHVVWRPDQLLGVDVAFCLDGYATDKTRIYFSGRAGDIPAEALRAHDAALEILRSAAASLRPGVRPSDLYRDAAGLARRLGVEEGFQGAGEDKVLFLGHGIGLAVDEWPALAERFDDPLEAGMVLALEPKIGLPGLGMVGAEETYRVAETGGEVLTGGPGPILSL